MPKIHLIEGPVGSGKSTFATTLSREVKAPRLTLDDWMATLFSPDRPPTDLIEWYSERKNRCMEQIWKVTTSIMEADSDVILELGLIQQKNRIDFLERIEATDLALKVYVLDAPREIRSERVKQRNLNKGFTYSMEVPDHIFEIASDMWESVDESEFYAYDVDFISTEYN